jgi:15-cis-phytoene synthase
MPQSLETELIAGLPPLSRLALAYAPSAARPVWLGVLALDARLAGVVRDAREPLIGQIRLAWWRERLAEEAKSWPVGEPLLALLRGWEGTHGPLGEMVDGWEIMLGEPPLEKESLLAAAEGRAAGLAAAAVRLGFPERREAVRYMGRRWALADFLANLSDPRERSEVETLLAETGAATPELPKALRPVTVLTGVGANRGAPLVRLLRAVRLGIFGR